MTRSIAMLMVRALAGTDEIIFNDKLVDGRRSIKVQGWSNADYKHAKRVLELEGFHVKIVYGDMQRARPTRLHVDECHSDFDLEF